MLLQEFEGDSLVRETQVDLSKSVITFGRLPSCEYRLFPSCPHVSRAQATLAKNGDDWNLIDGSMSGISSATGVWKDGRRIESPMRFLPGMAIVIFQYGNSRAVLSYPITEPETCHLQETYTGDGDLSEAISALRRDLLNVSNQCGQLSAVVEKLSAVVSATQAQDARQSGQLERHDKLISKIGLGMALALLSLSAWNLGSGGKDAVEKAINIFLAVAGGTGSTYLLQQKKSPEGREALGEKLERTTTA